MKEVTIKRLDEVEPYKGPNELEGIKFRAVGREVGVAAFGMNVLEIEPGTTHYPEHDHAKDGQEEIYVVLEGSATLHANGEDWELERGMAARVGPNVKRKWLPGEDGVTLLAIGATPGQAYKPR